jgi:PPOX class probable F420-dependent enzyme
MLSVAASVRFGKPLLVLASSSEPAEDRGGRRAVRRQSDRAGNNRTAVEEGPTVSKLHPGLRELVESGPMAHLSTINADGSPQVSVIWVGLDGDDLVSGHLAWHAKLRNLDRDPRAVLSFDAPRVPGAVMNPYAVVRARATIEPSDGTWDLLNRLTKVYVAPDAEFPAPKAPGYIVRYCVERVGGVGPWATTGG